MRHQDNNAGFTILELMISMVIFTVVMLIITSGVIHFTNDYYKGINSSTTQTDARAVVNNIAQAVQFSSTAPQQNSDTQTTGRICVGNDEFYYQLGNELPTGNYALYQQLDSGGTCSTYNAATTPALSTELLQAHTRLASLSMVPTGSNLWTISAVVAYGDDQLLCNGSLMPSAAGGCGSTAATITQLGVVTAGSHLRCKDEDGSQFCAVAQLSTTVAQRLETE